MERHVFRPAVRLCLLCFAAGFATTAMAGTPGLPFTEDFSDATLQDPALTNAKEGTQVAIMRRIENNPLAVLVVGNPLAGREDFVNRHQDSLGWCRPIHPGPSGSLLVQSGSMMRPTSASAPAHRMRPRSRCWLL